MRLIRLTLLTLAVVAVLPRFAVSADTLPYSTRALPFGAGAGGVLGDFREVGMAGATIGLGDTFFGSIESPAGPAMSLNGADAGLTGNWVFNQQIQNISQGVFTSGLGVAGTSYPWGVALGIVTPYREGTSYNVGTLDTSVGEFHATVARSFFNNRFSLGASMILGVADWRADDAAWSAMRLGAALGAMVQLPKRVLIGLSYQTPLTYSGSPKVSSPIVPGFFQNIIVPGNIDCGVGWIPNRYFKAGFALEWVPATPGAALIKNQGIAVGSNSTWTPRLGVGYTVADLKNLDVKMYAGTYLEASRVEGGASRVHVTYGMGLGPWIFFLGVGIDVADGYSNYFASGGVDLVKLFEVLDLVPKTYRAPYGAVLPPPFVLSDEGLARPLVKNWKPRPDFDAVKAIEQLPGRVGDKVKQTGKAIEKIEKSVVKQLKRRRKKKPTRRDRVRAHDHDHRSDP